MSASRGGPGYFRTEVSNPLLTLAIVGIEASAVAVSNARLLNNFQNTFD